MNFNYGYACINTELRAQKPPVFSSRTLRLQTLKARGIERAKELAIQNLKDLKKILEWNVQHKIYFMRMSSDMFPFANHEEYGYTLEFADELLKKIGEYAKHNGIRLTAHPSQYNVLSSPNEKVIANTMRDLNHHCEIMDRMALGIDSVMVIHGGGVYGNKQKALDRLEQNIMKLPENTRNRLVIENCEMAYTVEELLPISEKLEIPLIIDYHHDDINPSSNPIDFYHERVFNVWNKRGIKPKVHVSNSVPGVKKSDSKTARRKHSDLIYHLHEPLLKIKFPIDVMLEAKLKEQAIFKLRNQKN
jgi:UV DNA damage endonuclease